MKKTELYKLIDGKECLYTLQGYNENQRKYDFIVSQITEHNENRKEGEREITYKFTPGASVEAGGTLEISNGQIMFFPKAPKRGKIAVKSAYIIAAGVRIEKKDIVSESITEDSFKTINGTEITIF